MFAKTLFTLSTILPLVLSAPLFGFGDDDENNTPGTSISVQDVESKHLRSAQFTRVAYCSSAAVTSWQCGPPCDVIGKGVKVIQAGGDDGLIPMYFVANDPADNSIIVAHQGTNPTHVLSIVNDIKFLPKDLNATRFASLKGKGLKVHDGFQQTFERTADGVLSAVKQGMADFKTNKVRVAGHSLGAAIAVLDSVMLKQELGDSIDLQTSVFGMPRTGNQEFADFVDSTLGDTFVRITNQNDPVPRLPPRDPFGFQHTSGEIHIKSVDDAGQATELLACPGQENENCADGNNPLSLTGIPNHLGPYFDDISFSELACPA
ncbi:hypothetical protein V5O48_002493 [Marasmius crinis-equi]|uniref:Fungal lipase-type domain-containing protein n=1 Tax=Marasmius crinis-equi TaxID=585013 RepID=A0ABR3FWJ3_9AGAR